MAMATILLRVIRSKHAGTTAAILMVASQPLAIGLEKPPQAFEHMGQIACGLSYAHVHTKIYVSMERLDILNAVNEIDREVNQTADKFFNIKTRNATSKGLKAWWRPQKLHLVEKVLELKAMKNHFVEEEVAARRKRQLDPLGTIVNFGFELFNANQISELKERLKNDEDRIYLHSIKTDREISSKIKKYASEIQNEVRRVVGAQNDYFKTLKLDIIKLHIEHMVDKVRKRIEDDINFYYELRMGRLRPSIFDPQDLRKQLKKMESSLKANNLEFLHDAMRDFFRFHLSYNVEGEDLNLFVHVPITSGGKMNLFRMAPVPFFAKDGLLFTISADKEVLAVNKDHSKSIALNDGKLAACRKVGRLHYCDGLRVARKNIASTCVGAVFSGHKKAIKENCDIAVSKLGEEVLEINRTTFMVMSSNSVVRVQSECRPQGTMIQNQGLVTIKPGCNGFTHKFWFSSGKDFTIPMEVAPSPIELGEDLIDYGQFSLEDIKQFTLDHGVLDHQEQMKMEHLQALMYDKDGVRTSHSALHGLWIFVVISIIISGGVASYIFILARTAKKRRQRNRKGFGQMMKRQEAGEHSQGEAEEIGQDVPSANDEDEPRA